MYQRHVIQRTKLDAAGKKVVLERRECAIAEEATAQLTELGDAPAGQSYEIVVEERE